MIYVTVPLKVKNILKVNNKSLMWCYLGNDIKRRTKITNTLGIDKRYYLKNRLHAVAEELRQVYLDFIAKLGSEQKEYLHWWASSFASKSPLQNDFFLNICYQVLIGELIDEFNTKQKDICIIIEDPWLFQSLKNRYGGRDISFVESRFGLIKKKIYFLSRGITLRSLLALQLVLSYFLLFYFYMNTKLKDSIKGRCVVAIMSYASKEHFEEKRYNDLYTGELFNYLKGQNIPVIRLIHTNISLKVIRDIGRLKDFLWPIILELKGYDLFVVFKHWKLDVSGDEGIFDPITCKWLFKREVWFEFSRMGFIRNLIFYNLIKRTFKKNWFAVLIYTYENLPWEKMLCIAAKEFKQLRVIGYQHSTIPRFYLSHFLGKHENTFIPLPKVLITSSMYYKNILLTAGIPNNILVNGGSWRYSYLRAINQKNKIFLKDQKKTILIALPMNKSIAEILLNELICSFVNGDIMGNLKFWVKFHPANSTSRLNIPFKNLNNFRIVKNSIQELLKKIDVVIYSASNTGLESLLHNIKTICYVPESLINIDCFEGIDNISLEYCYEGELKKILLKMINEQNKMIRDNDTAHLFFDKVIPEIWLKEIGVDISGS